MRKKFKIFYSKDHSDPDKAGKKYKPSSGDMVVMNSGGVFFLYSGTSFYPSLHRLVDKIGNYDVIWSKGEDNEG